uniref:Uncharacterized protein n=1 Tax=Anguilla anguilla TaxID=7936 RepID=A0A0E9RPP9_ANGAN
MKHTYTHACTLSHSLFLYLSLSLSPSLSLLLSLPFFSPFCLFLFVIINSFIVLFIS